MTARRPTKTHRRAGLLVAGATLDAGDRVEFEAREGGMGAQAIDVRSVLADDAAGGSLRDTPVTSRKEGVMVVDTHLGESALRRESETPDVRAVRLDWHEFSASLFPHGRSALGGSAVMVWDWEGGAAAVEDSSGEEVSERVCTAGIQ